MNRTRTILFVVAALTVAQPAMAAISPPADVAKPAADMEKDGAAQAVAIFLNCAHFGDDVSGLRKWAAQAGMAEAPPDQAKPFLLGKSGNAYGGNTPSGELILASQDNGVCTVFAGHAEGKGNFVVVEVIALPTGSGFAP